MKKNFDFYGDFISEEELDEYLKFFKKQIECENDKTSIINPERLSEFVYCYKILEYLVKETGASVSYVLNEPFKSMGCITISGYDITIREPKLFMVAVDFATNLEIYSGENGLCNMDFTFHDMTEIFAKDVDAGGGEDMDEDGEDEDDEDFDDEYFIE